MNHVYDLIVIGGGAAGFFAALAAKNENPHAAVAILEKSAVLLSKVRISGGGRCNVTHGCFDPLLFSKHYPRGEKELLGPFHRFQAKDTMHWFESRGVSLKIEEDGRVFPTTDQSETIINALLNEAKKCGIEIHFRQKIEKIEKQNDEFHIHGKETTFVCKKLILATGNSIEGHACAAHFGHSIQPPVPSLFTFNIPDSPLSELSGISFEKVTVQLRGTSFIQTGPLLITHFGFSGPAVLKLSAWAARYLHEKEYCFEVLINWLGKLSREEISGRLRKIKTAASDKNLLTENPFLLPKSFWKFILTQLGDDYFKRLHDISFKQIESLAEKLQADHYQVRGKTTHKEEFVTCGGIHLKEINFKTMESKVCPGLFFAGEILDIDGITGGFNFQNAWTTGFIAGSSCLS